MSYLYSEHIVKYNAMPLTAKHNNHQTAERGLTGHLEEAAE